MLFIPIVMVRFEYISAYPDFNFIGVILGLFKSSYHNYNTADWLKYDGPAIKLVGVAERMPAGSVILQNKGNKITNL
jgi:hypothetical protein